MAVTVSYNAKVFNSQGQPTFIFNTTTPPTAAQASTVQDIFCQVIFGADNDTQAVLTHNWALSASDSINFGYPQIQYYEIAQLATNGTQQTSQPVVTFNIIANTNSVQMNKTISTSSASTWNVHLRRPWSASQ